MQSSSPSSSTTVHSFTIDDEILKHVHKYAGQFAPVSTKLAVGAVGGVAGGALGAVAGGAVMGDKLRKNFLDGLFTRPGTFALSLHEQGIGITDSHGRNVTMRWSDIERWAINKKVFMAMSRSGQSIILPVAQLPAELISMIEGICMAALPSHAEQRIAVAGKYKDWDRISTGEKIVRGAVFTIAAIVLVFALLIFTMVAIHA